ncbi:hypothetical protein P171DRAFT_433735 [Karstenula rhodostoma CBS 690.94]|uniref:ASST-domain-containing protein n=1 Tax=Karstenula rhodostoma CBS 690.94 TaxID=1392251 RepID=A0A9P4U9N3_9PLEO|nr:hypothetical protein P171DRAFT_433735 [Karstenula rhodostoma CBS 690.94]
MKTLVLGAVAALRCVYAQDSVSFDFDNYGKDDASGTPYQTFKSNADVKPPQLQINKNETGLADGLVFIGVDGAPTSGQNWPSIWDFSPDRMGTLVWTGNYTEPFDFRTQTYKGEPVLTFWSGELLDGYGHGSYYILNQSYAEIAHFSAVGYKELSDLHEFSITTDDTALVIIYTPKQADLSDVGGDQDGWIFDCVFQEIDIDSGRLVFEWNASTHVGVNETVNELGDAGSEASPFDYFHMNSVLKDANGDYLISGRVMDAVFKISSSGDILWRLGGKQSDFDVADDAVFAFQHDARWVDANQTRMTIFDNGPTDAVGYSRGLLFDVDQAAKTVSLIQEFYNGAKTFAKFEGSLQVLDPTSTDTNYFLGYGNQPFLAEFSADGTLLLDVQFGATNAVNGYRAYKLAWTGKPATNPDIHLDADANAAYVSWNGATDVEWWDVYSANATNGTWRYAASANRTGFETTVDLGGGGVDKYLRARAVNGSGDALGWTRATDGNGMFDASGDVDEEKNSTSSSAVSTTASTTARSTGSSATTAAAASATSGLAVRIGRGMVEKVVVAVVVVALV